MANAVPNTRGLNMHRWLHWVYRGSRWVNWGSRWVRKAFLDTNMFPVGKIRWINVRLTVNPDVGMT